MDSFALIIFGITSNLAKIKLIPALYDLEEKGMLPDNMTIVGIARGEKTDEELRSYFKEVLASDNVHHQHAIKDEIFQSLAKRTRYISGNLDEPGFYKRLSTKLDELNSQGFDCQNRIYYLATYPDIYQEIFEGLQKNQMNTEEKGWARLMIEKPIGSDLKSAKELNQLLLKYFKENQIYRLDHYLGKETLQNILTFRFDNGVFEPILNKEHVDHIQITASENFGVGMRGGYYDSVGALKDVGQNHQLQMLAFATMDAPGEFSNEEVTAQRLKILEALKPDPKSLVLGQYEDYQSEPNVHPESTTDTFYALKAEIDNERFRGVPVYIRAGKKLEKTITEISIIFKKPDNRLSKHLALAEEPNALIYRLFPNEGIVLKFLSKKPGPEMDLETNYMQFCYRQDRHGHVFPDPYERLIMDTIRGDQTFFNDAPEVEAQWAFIDPLIENKPKPAPYKNGGWGPKEAFDLIEKDGRSWLEPSLEFCPI